MWLISLSFLNIINTSTNSSKINQIIYYDIHEFYGFYFNSYMRGV